MSLSEAPRLGRPVGSGRANQAPGTTEPLISGHALTVVLGGRTVLDSVDIAIRPREIVTLIGLNGSGKSTLARALLGLTPLSAGRIERRPDLKIGYVPQTMTRDPALPLTVERFVALAGRASRAAIDAELEAFGVPHLSRAQVATLSGGELRRVLLARALLRNPNLLVLDEPMSGVDVSGQAELYRLIANVRNTRDVGILLISHDLHLVMAETDHVVCLNHHVCCAGGPEFVVRDPSFAALFGRDIAGALAVYRHHHDHTHDPDGAVHHQHGPGCRHE